jgi:ATP-binding cassette subfamily C protein LapB
VLSLAGIVFSMQVYDRVIPAQSYPTLYVLTIGVLIATLFGFVLRLARGHIMDLLGKRADLRVSDRVFGHALRLRNSAVPRSTGSFISQLRELEQIREMVTSSTISTIVDLPFFVVCAGTGDHCAATGMDCSGCSCAHGLARFAVAEKAGGAG